MAGKTSSLDLFRSAVTEIKQAQLFPVYLISGGEEFFVERFIKVIQDIIPVHERDFNSDYLFGNESTLDAVLQLVKSFPMMAERRLVIVKNADSLLKNGGAATLEVFQQYLSHPNPQSVLVLHVESKIPKNTKLGKSLSQKSVRTLEFEPLADYQLAGWILGWAKQEYNLQLSEQLAQLIAQLVGNDLKLLSTEIEKIGTYTSTYEGEITLDHIKDVIGNYRGFDVFELKEAIHKKQLDQAFFIAQRILQQSKSDTGEIIRIIAFLCADFSKLWQIVRLQQSNKSEQFIKQQLHIGSPYYFKRLVQDAKKYSLDDLEGIFNALLDADRAVKGFTTMDISGIMMLLVKRLVHPHHYA